MLPIATSIFLTAMGLTILIPAAFAVTVIVLWKLALPKMKQAVAERRDAIRKVVSDAEAARAEGEAMKVEARERLAAARKQADDLVVRARQAAEAHGQRAEEAAHAKAEEIVAHARKEIATEERRVVERLRRGIADVTVGAAEQVVRGSLDEKDHRDLVEAALAEVDFHRMTAGRS